MKETYKKSDVKVLNVLGTVKAGFPSPHSDYHDESISIEDFLIRDRDASYMIKISGDNLKSLGIYKGDIAIVERGLDPKSGDLVLAKSRGQNEEEKYKIVPFSPIKSNSESKSSEQIVEAVVVSLIRKYK